MNTESTLRLKVKTIKRLEEEFNRDELVESEMDDLEELIFEMRDLAEQFIKDIGPEEVVKRVGRDHWLVTGEGIEEESSSIVLEGLEELLGKI